MVVLRRHVHPLAGLVWALVLILALLPLLVVGLALGVTVRTHRRWRSWQRTLGMAATWLAGFVLVGSVVLLGWPPQCLVLLPLAAVAWSADAAWRRRAPR